MLIPLNPNSVKEYEQIFQIKMEGIKYTEEMSTLCTGIKDQSPQITLALDILTYCKLTNQRFLGYMVS